MRAPRAFVRAGDARSSRSSRASRQRDRRARAVTTNAPHAGRARRGLPRRTVRMRKPRVRRTSRRRGVSSGARTSGRKQLKPSSRSGCPPSSVFTRFTTSPVSDLRMERRRGQQRGRWRPKACVEFEHEKRQWKPRSFSHAPGVLEVAHDLEELLVRLGARADEPRLHRPDVLQRILGRFPARRDRGSHLTVIDSAPGTRFTRSPEGMRKTTSVRRTRAHDVTRRVYARSIAPNRTRARSGRRCSDVALARGVDCAAAARLRRTPRPVSGISRGRHSSWLARRQTRRFLIQAGLGIFRRERAGPLGCLSQREKKRSERK